MSREPSYPKDAPVGTAPAATTIGSDGAAQEKSGDSRRRKQIMTGAAIGIGSAAIVAALLYANRNRKNDRR
jgi:hypothetical protein